MPHLARRRVRPKRNYELARQRGGARARLFQPFTLITGQHPLPKEFAQRRRSLRGGRIIVMGIAGSLNDALQMATTGMARWLEQEYKLNTGEIAMVLGSSMHYDIAEIVDPQVHVVAKLSKTVLSQIPKP